MIGQEILQKQLNELTLDTMPRSIILVGSTGCGKHMYSSLIANKLKLELVDITKTLNQETIEEINLRSSPYVYLIDSTNISIREQNIILKFLEQPLKNSYVIILTTDTSKLLKTVLSRCIIYRFQSYTKDQLTHFISNEENKQLIYELFDTPGKIITYQDQNIKDIVNLCKKIIDKIGQANISNTLTLSQQLAFKNEKNKINIYLFQIVLLYVITERIKNQTNNISYKQYQEISQYCNKAQITNIDQKALFENFIVTLWGASRLYGTK